MRLVRSRRFSQKCLLVVTMLALLCGATVAQADRIPRILYVGDSWTGFMWGFRSMKTALDDPDYAADGLNRWIETGVRTAIMGAKTYEFKAEARKAIIAEDLKNNPNIDVVLMTLGGNDYLGGFPLEHFPYNPGAEKDWYNWFEDNNDSNPANDWDVNILFDQLRDDLREVMTYILDQRPDLRIVLVGYDYTARKCYQRNGLTLPVQSQSLVAMEAMKRDLCQEAAFNGRAIYVQSFGLIQNHYGYFTSNEWGDTGVKPYPAARPLSEVDVQPGVAPLPGEWDTNYLPWPGGDPNWQDPRAAYVDEDIHLQKEGYDLSAKHAVDVIIRKLLNYPKVLSVIPGAKTGNSQQFDVTFTHPVSGVDVTDFEVFLGPAKSMKAMSITGVTAVGSGEKYIVTVDVQGTSGNILVRVLDDDSIVRTDDNTITLGGTGVGNGLFEYDGVYAFEDLTRPADDDFIGALSYLDTVLTIYLADFAPNISFAPDKFDANGDIMELANALMSGGDVDPNVKIPGNSVLDSYEFSLIKYLIDHPELDFSANGGAKASEVIAAWNTNIAQMQSDLDGIGGVADALLPGLDSMLAGYMTVGDAQSINLATVLVFALTQVEEDFPGIHINPVDKNSYVSLPLVLATTADADGDGYTNEEEYAYFYPDGQEGYAAAALNPALHPTVPNERFEQGVDIRLAMTDHPDWDSSFQWFRNGQALVDGNGIVGSQQRCLRFLPIMAGDAGSYTCRYQILDPNAKAPRALIYQTFGPIKLNVVANIPVAGLAGLFSLAAATALSGIAALRKRR